jgi:hypothetical protein
MNEFQKTIRKRLEERMQKNRLSKLALYYKTIDNRNRGVPMIRWENRFSDQS